MRDLIILRIGPTESPIQLHNGSLYFSIKTDLYRILRVTRGPLFGPVKNKPRDANACRFDFGPPEFLSEIIDHVIEFRFWSSSNNWKWIKIKIRIFWSHRIKKLFEFWFQSTYNRSNWSKIEILNNSKVDQNQYFEQFESGSKSKFNHVIIYFGEEFEWTGICLTWLILSWTKKWTPAYRGGRY